MLTACDAVAAEDTRRSKVLLDHFGIHKPLLHLDQHSSQEALASALGCGHLAYVSDAGTPGLSDPGAELLQAALALGHRVEVLPGPTALIPALLLSGLPPVPFHFEGFLPRKGAERRRRLEQLAPRQATSVIYESPLRLAATLRELVALCGGERRASVTRELSKLHEETFRGNLQEAAAHFSGRVRGEVVLVVSPAPPAPARPAGTDYAALAAELASSGSSALQIRRALVSAGMRRNDAYVLALEAAGKRPETT